MNRSWLRLMGGAFEIFCFFRFLSLRSLFPSHGAPGHQLAAVAPGIKPRQKLIERSVLGRCGLGVDLNFWFFKHWIFERAV
jgi:hypothetical protein